MPHSVKTLLLLFTFSYLLACSPMTPVLMVEAGNHKLMLYQKEIRLKAAAALAEEPDLISYSLKSIAENKQTKAIDTFLLGYGKENYSQDMKSIAIYQIALIYMSRLNEQRDDEKAKLYLHRHLIEFPYSILQERILAHIKIINDRKHKTVKLNPKQILAQYDATTLLSKSTLTFDEDLTPLSQRLITEERIADANALYAVVYENPGSHDKIKAKSLYQLGLIYMSPHNKEFNLQKSIGFFRKIIAEFPDTLFAKKAQHKITKAINQNQQATY